MKESGYQLLMGLSLLVLVMGPGGIAAQPQELPVELGQALEAEASTQEEVDAWHEEKQEIVDRILHMKTRLRWLRYQNNKHVSYIAQQKKNLTELANRGEVLGTLRMKLAPYLDETLTRLKSAVAADRPFLPQERHDRLRFLDKSLSAYDVDLSERLRRVLQALEVEAGYGDSVEVRDRQVSVKGDKTLVRVLRLGRIALFYLIGDGAGVGKWDPDSGSWQPLPQEYGSTILKTMDMVSQKRAVEFVDLPLAMDKQQGTSE